MEPARAPSSPSRLIGGVGNGQSSRHPVSSGNRRYRPTTARRPGGKRTRRGRREPTFPTRDARREAIDWRSECAAKRPGASETRFSTFPAPPCRRSKRHEGTDRGDAVRLSTRSSSKGVNSVARSRSTIPGAIPGSRAGKTRRTSDRQRGATNPRSPGGASRPGSAKLRRRNGSGRVAPFARRSCASGSGSGHRGPRRWG